MRPQHQVIHPHPATDDNESPLSAIKLVVENPVTSNSLENGNISSGSFNSAWLSGDYIYDETENYTSSNLGYGYISTFTDSSGDYRYVILNNADTSGRWEIWKITPYPSLGTVNETIANTNLHTDDNLNSIADGSSLYIEHEEMFGDAISNVDWGIRVYSGESTPSPTPSYSPTPSGVQSSPTPTPSGVQSSPTPSPSPSPNYGSPTPSPSPSPNYGYGSPSPSPSPNYMEMVLRVRHRVQIMEMGLRLQVECNRLQLRVRHQVQIMDMGLRVRHQVQIMEMGLRLQVECNRLQLRVRHQVQIMEMGLRLQVECNRLQLRVRHRVQIMEMGLRLQVECNRLQLRVRHQVQIMEMVLQLRVLRPNHMGHRHILNLEV